MWAPTASATVIVKFSSSSYSKPQNALRGHEMMKYEHIFILLKSGSEAGELLPLQIKNISRPAQHNTVKLPLHLLSDFI